METIPHVLSPSLFIADQEWLGVLVMTRYTRLCLVTLYIPLHLFSRSSVYSLAGYSPELEVVGWKRLMVMLFHISIYCSHPLSFMNFVETYFPIPIWRWSTGTWWLFWSTHALFWASVCHLKPTRFLDSMDCKKLVFFLSLLDLITHFW